MVQFGEIEEPLCVVEEVLNHPNGNRALQVALSNEAAAWVRDTFEGRIVDLMHEHVESWFGKALSRPNVKRMLCSCMVGNSIVLNCSKGLQCYRTEQDSDDLARVDFADVAVNDIVVPIVHFAGLSISSRHFTPSFNLHNVVAVDRMVDEEVAAEDGAPFFFSQTPEEEIIDPFSYFARNADAMSQNSFDTQAWQ
jgi:hypothetical protein